MKTTSSKRTHPHPLLPLLEAERPSALACARAFWTARGNAELADVFADLFLAEPRSVEENGVVGAWRPRAALKDAYFASCREDEALTSKRFLSLRNVYEPGSEWMRNRLTSFRIQLESVRVRKQMFYRFRFDFHDNGARDGPAPAERPKFAVRLAPRSDHAGAPAEISTEAQIHVLAANTPLARFRREIRVRALVHEPTWISGCINANNSTRGKFNRLVNAHWSAEGRGHYDGLLIGVEGWSVQGFGTDELTLALNLTRVFHRERFFLSAHWGAEVHPSLEDPPTMTYREWCRIGDQSARLAGPVHILQVSIAVLLLGPNPKFVLVQHPGWRDDVPARTPTTPVRCGIECNTLEEHESPPLKALAVIRLYEEVGLRVPQDDLHFTGFGMVYADLFKTWTPVLFGLAVCRLSEDEFRDAFSRGKFSGRFVEKAEIVPRGEIAKRLQTAPRESARDAAHMLALLYLGEAETV